MASKITTTKKQIVNVFKNWAADVRKRPHKFYAADDPAIKPEDTADEFIKRLLK